MLEILQSKSILTSSRDDCAGLLGRELRGTRRIDLPRKSRVLQDGGPDGSAEGSVQSTWMAGEGSAEPNVRTAVPLRRLILC